MTKTPAAGEHDEGLQGNMQCDTITNGSSLEVNDREFNLDIIPYHLDGELVRPRESPNHWDEDIGEKLPETDHIADLELGEELEEALRDDRNRHGLIALLLSRLGTERWKDVERLTRASDAEMKAALSMTDNAKLLEYQRRFFVVKDFGGKVRVCWFNSEGEFRTRSTQSFREAEENQKIDVEVPTAEGTKTIHKPAADFWLRHASRAEYEEARFAPGKRLPSNIFNL